MQTEVLEASEAALARAARMLEQGDIVAFPTETVYGLGARADKASGVRKIFAAKGRPSKKALIVHVSGIEQARTVTALWDERAERLTRALWPGPLTVVLPRASWVPDEVTGGGDTVAVRAPAHDVAQRLIAACGAPIAAPSANLSGDPPPTTAAEVVRSLGGRIPLVLDAGPTTLMVPSTVIALQRDGARILREGAIAAAKIARLLVLAEPAADS